MLRAVPRPLLSPCSSYRACTVVAGALLGAVSIHQKQLLRRSDVGISALLCELSADVQRTFCIEKAKRKEKKDIKNTTAMLPSGFTQMWHREELGFCSFMFP